MKARITSNFRPLLRAFYPFLTVIAVLWAMPRNAHAQHLYVSNKFAGQLVVVSEYNATTGKLINLNFIRGLATADALAVSGNDLFVAGAFFKLSAVSKYDATTGSSISPGFITTGLHNPSALAISDNTLFVANLGGRHRGGTGTVGKYDATTGEVINARLITGLITPIHAGVPQGLAVSDNDPLPRNKLFLANIPNGTVDEYDATTGEVIKANFITGLDFPVALALLDNTLFVANFGNQTVGKYDAATGEVINTRFITGLFDPIGLAVLDDALFVLNRGVPGKKATVGKYDATTGEVIKENFILGLTEVFAIAVKSAK